VLRRRLVAGLVAAGTLVTVGVSSPPAIATDPQPSTIAVIGDIPYGAAKLAEFPADIADINDDADVSLVVHLGDIKNGSSVCSDEYFTTIQTDFALFDDPLVYTPGDNEWTDCHRPAAGGYQPLERLARVREDFFPVPGTTLGQHPIQVTTQSGDPAYADYVENTMWSQSGAVFAALNVPGSNNDLVPWFGVTPLTSPQQHEFDARLDADIAWLNAAFAEAKRTGAKGVGLLLQADMWDPAALGGDGLDGYDRIVGRIGTLAKKFGGPVLMLEGDSHVFRVDHPFTATDPLYGYHPLSPRGLEAPNVTRVVVDGSGNAHDWLKLVIDPTDPEVFSWTQVNFT
jgi:Calcineurin-like phosphoesterase